MSLVLVLVLVLNSLYLMERFRSPMREWFRSTLKSVLILLTGGLLALNAIAAEAPARPLHVLYLGPVSVGGGLGGRGDGGAPATYVYLPGQTLAPEAIYFDHC